MHPQELVAQMQSTFLRFKVLNVIEAAVEMFNDNGTHITRYMFGFFC